MTMSMKDERRWHAATLLTSSGEVLVSGGFSGEAPLRSVEIYDLAKVEWRPGAPLAAARYGHTAILLTPNEVLVTGGMGFDGALSSAELYDSATDKWSSAGFMSSARTNHTATLLRSGQVLVVGGEAQDNCLTSTEVYDPGLGKWRHEGNLSFPRTRHTATRLHSGLVLVVGGFACGGYLLEAELYNPITGKWSPASPLISARADHSATLLESGHVLVAGGSGPDGPLSSVELYDPATGQWQQASHLPSPRTRHQATLLPSPRTKPDEGTSYPSGQVLLSGGSGPLGELDSSVFYEPSTGKWRPTAHMTIPRDGHTATLLPSTQILVAGGFTSGDFAYYSNAELFEDGFFPPAPVITVPADDMVSYDGWVVYEGTAEPGNTVFIYVDEPFMYRDWVTADAKGKWVLPSSSRLRNGAHVVWASAMDHGGKPAPDSEPKSFEVWLPRSHYGWSCAAACSTAPLWWVALFSMAFLRRRPCIGGREAVNARRTPS